MDSKNPKYIKATPRGHHYVPRRYLLGFCIPGADRLSLYDRERNEYRENTSVSQVAKKRDFNVITDLDRNKDFSFEAELEKYESKGIDVINKIDRRETISLAEREALAIYASLQQKRTISFQKTFETAVELTVKDILANVFDEVKNKTGDQLFPDTQSEIELLENVGKDVDKEVRRNAGIEAMIVSAEQHAESLLQLG